MVYVLLSLKQNVIALMLFKITVQYDLTEITAILIGLEPK